MIPTRNSPRLLLGQLRNLHTELQDTKALYALSTKRLQATPESQQVYEMDSPYYASLLNHVDITLKLHEISSKFFQTADRYVVGSTDRVCNLFHMKIRQYTPISPGNLELQFQSTETETSPEKLQEFYQQLEIEKKAAASTLTKLYPDLFTVQPIEAAEQKVSGDEDKDLQIPRSKQCSNSPTKRAKHEKTQ